MVSNLLQGLRKFIECEIEDATHNFDPIKINIEVGDRSGELMAVVDFVFRLSR